MGDPPGYVCQELLVAVHSDLVGHVEHLRLRAEEGDGEAAAGDNAKVRNSDSLKKLVTLVSVFLSCTISPIYDFVFIYLRVCQMLKILSFRSCNSKKDL